ncbi:MAG TPA: DUF433 domain-containing protein [Bryobacteraceae bacterium]|nr:DUF433 domain-containing protein [Bryobacteraceae bacterium]
MDFPQNIEVPPDVMMGKPCFAGTRIPVYLILKKLAAGETAKEILDAYPQLAPEHIRAALEYAAQLASEEVIITF